MKTKKRGSHTTLTFKRARDLADFIAPGELYDTATNDERALALTELIAGIADEPAEEKRFVLARAACAAAYENTDSFDSVLEIFIDNAKAGTWQKAKGGVK